MGQRPIDPSQGPVTPSPGSQIPGPPVVGPVGTPRPGPQPPQQPQPQQPGTKTNRVTSVAKPAGLDPLLILQERENRYLTFIHCDEMELNILYEILICTLILLLFFFFFLHFSLGLWTFIKQSCGTY